MRIIAADELKARLDQNSVFEFWNVLTDDYYTGEMIPGSRKVPVDQVGREVSRIQLPKDAAVVVCCSGPDCPQSQAAAEKLAALGFGNISLTCRERPDLAELYTAGTPVESPGGLTTQFGIPFSTISSPAEAPAFVRGRVADGSDYIRIIYEPSVPFFTSISRETLTAVIAAAHAEGVLGVVHVSSLEGARDAVAAGADVLAHGFADAHIDNALLQQMTERGTYVTPTLSSRIVPGARADLLLVDANPLEDIELTRAIVRIFRNGVESHVRCRPHRQRAADRERPGGLAATAIANRTV